MSENVERKENYNQVCIWPACIVTETQDLTEIKKFEEFMLENFKTRVQYLEEIKTFPDIDSSGNPVPDTGNRNDLLFAVHDQDIPKFAIPRLSVGIRWIEDALASCNNSQHLYPERVWKYKGWMLEDKKRA